MYWSAVQVHNLIPSPPTYLPKRCITLRHYTLRVKGALFCSIILSHAWMAAVGYGGNCMYCTVLSIPESASILERVPFNHFGCFIYPLRKQSQGAHSEMSSIRVIDLGLIPQNFIEYIEALILTSYRYLSNPSFTPETS